MIQYGRDAGLLMRYETKIERSMCRALYELGVYQQTWDEGERPRRSTPGFKAA